MDENGPDTGITGALVILAAIAATAIFIVVSVLPFVFGKGATP